MDTNSSNSFEFRSVGQSQGHSFWLDVLIFIAVAVALYAAFKLVASKLPKSNRDIKSRRRTILTKGNEDNERIFATQQN